MDPKEKPVLRNQGTALVKLRKVRTIETLTPRSKCPKPALNVGRSLQFQHKLENKLKKIEDANALDSPRHRHTKELKKLVEAVNKASLRAEQRVALEAIRKFYANKQYSEEQLKVSGVIPMLMKFLSPDIPSVLQYEALRVLHVLTSDRDSEIKQVSEVMPFLLKLLSSKEPTICEEAAWSLGNIIGNSTEMRRYAVERGVTETLLFFIKPNISYSMVRSINWVFQNLCYHKNEQLSAVSLNQILLALKRVLENTDRQILQVTIFTISDLIQSGIKIEDFYKVGLLAKLITLLNSNEEVVVLCVLVVVGNIVFDAKEHMHFLLESKLLAHLHKVLLSKKSEILNQTLSILTTITTNGPEDIDLLIKAELLPKIMDIIRSQKGHTRNEAIWIIYNIVVFGCQKHTLLAINVGAVRALCALLDCDDDITIGVALGTLEKILAKDKKDIAFRAIKECEGWKIIYQLKNHKKEDIKETANSILDAYFMNHE